MMNKLAVLLTIAVGLVIVGTHWPHARLPDDQIEHSGNVSSSRSTTRSNPTLGARTEAGAYQASQLDKSELDLAVGNAATLLITDSAGRHTGRDSSTNVPLHQIPQSTYFEDTIDDSDVAAKQVNHFIQVTQPKTGRYSVLLTGLRAGQYQLSIRAFSRDGSSQPELVETGDVRQGSKVTFDLDYTSAPGTALSVTKRSN
jgi:hypothetical protein